MRDLHGLLRSETAAAHERLEALPYFQALHAGGLPVPAIVSFLRSFAIVHAVLERELSCVSDVRIRELGAHAFPKVPLLAADLETLGAQNRPSISQAIQAALECGADILARAEAPLTLIGSLYVLEGSQAGGFALKAAYARCLGVSEQRLSYFGCYGSDTPRHWGAFVERLNALVLTDEEAAQIARSAVRCFEHIQTICSSLHPYSGADLRHHVAAINPEAGDHAMPQDPREIALALRAGRTAWTAYPYLAHRFGDRGKRFTGSDSCWLVALTRMPVQTATKNLQWLRVVLASRGIPTVILQSHLRTISQALADEFPDEPELSARFDPFLSALDRERETTGGARLAHVVEQAGRRLALCPGFTVASAAQLIASAWRDERCGIDGARAASVGWFLSAERFSPEWIAEVDALVAALDRGASC